jgi:hypothetical protein
MHIILVIKCKFKKVSKLLVQFEEISMTDFYNKPKKVKKKKKFFYSS